MMKFQIICTSNWDNTLLDVYKKRLTDAGFLMTFEDTGTYIYTHDEEDLLQISDIVENELIIRKDKIGIPIIEIYDDWRE